MDEILAMLLMNQAIILSIMACPDDCHINIKEQISKSMALVQDLLGMAALPSLMGEQDA